MQTLFWWNCNFVSNVNNCKISIFGLEQGNTQDPHVIMDNAVWGNLSWQILATQLQHQHACQHHQHNTNIWQQHLLLTMTWQKVWRRTSGIWTGHCTRTVFTDIIHTCQKLYRGWRMREEHVKWPVKERIVPESFEKCGEKETFQIQDAMLRRTRGKNHMR